MAVDVNATRRQRAWGAIQDSSLRTWSLRLRGTNYGITLSNPQIRTLNGGLVFSVDMQVTKDGVLFFDDRVNMPNPPQGIRVDDTTVTDNPLQALRDTLLDVLRSCTKGLTTPHLMRSPDGQFMGDTLAVRSGTADGTVESDHPNIATARSGASLVANTTATSSLTQWTLSGSDYIGRYAFFIFDTSTLGTSATITAAVYTLYGTGTAEGDTNGYNAEIRYKDFGGTVTTADWFDPSGTGWTGLVSGGTFDVTSWNQTAETANNFSDSGVYTSISKTSNTMVVVGMSGMPASTPTGANRINFRMADNAGTTSDPLLTVTYVVPLVLTPGAGSLTITAQTPTVRINTILKPGSLSNSITAQTPTIKINYILKPGAGSIALTAYTPTVVAGSGGITLTPGAASLTLTAQTPTVYFTTRLYPGAGSLTVTAYTATLVFNTRLYPGAASVAITGQQATLRTTIFPGAASAAITGTGSVLKTSIFPGSASLAINAQTASLVFNTRLYPAAGSLAITGQQATLRTTIFPGAGSLAVTGQTPATVLTTRLYPGAGALAITGYTPTLVFNTILRPGAGSLTATAYAASLRTTIFPGAASASLTGFTPSLHTRIFPGAGTLTLTPYVVVIRVNPITFGIGRYAPIGTGEGVYAPIALGDGRYALIAIGDGVYDPTAEGRGRITG